MTDWTDETAISFLEAQGFVLGKDWVFRHPSEFAWADLSDQQRDAIWYLVIEWDFGGYIDAMG